MSRCFPESIALIIVEPAGKASFLEGSMQTRFTMDPHEPHLCVKTADNCHNRHIFVLFILFRRYSRLQSRYTHLRLYSDGAQLRDRDPLVENETDMEEEPSLYPQPGGSLRYIPVPTSAEPQTDSDDELIGNFQAGN